MPTQVWPALVRPPHDARPSAAASRSASASTIIASLPPHSSSTGVSVSAQAAMTFLPVRGRAGERDLVDAGAAQRGADVARRRGRSAAPDARARSRRSVSTNQLPDGRGVLARLEHDRVAGRERIGDRAHRREDRVVPRADHADHAVTAGTPGTRRAPAAGAEPRDPARPEHPLRVLGRPGDVIERGDDLDAAPRPAACRPPGGSARRARPCGWRAALRQRSSRLRRPAKPSPAHHGAGVAGPGDGGARRRRRRRPGTGRPPRRWRGWWRSARRPRRRARRGYG